MVLRVELNDAEGNRLHRLMKATRDVVVPPRAMVVMQSAQGYTSPRIAELMGHDVGYVWEIIKAFTAGGFDSPNPKWGGGRPRTFTDEVRRELAKLGFGAPHQGADHCSRRDILPRPCHEWLSGCDAAD